MELLAIMPCVLGFVGARGRRNALGGQGDVDEGDGLVVRIEGAQDGLELGYLCSIKRIYTVS